MVADLVKPGETLADIGCDHGYLSIWLVDNGVVSRAVAMDLREGPLMHAKENVSFFGKNEQIETRLSDGMNELRPGEADRIVIAGMGGILMSDILHRGRECVKMASQLVLQPQSDVDLVRQAVHDNGYCIVDERACYEDGKYYVCFSCEPGTEERPYTEAEYRYGRILPARKDAVYLRYLAAELEKRERMLSGLLAAETDTARERIPSAQEEIAQLRALL